MSGGQGGAPAVDIVITNHNYGRYLGEAIESALGQTHPGVRVIVVDDGSVDESRNVLHAFEDRVEVVLKQRGGQASALNVGIEHCSGDVLLLLDSDDMLRPEAAARVASAFEGNPELAKVQFRMAVIDADGRPTGTKPTGHLLPPSGDARAAELAFPFDIAWLPGGGTAFQTRLVRRLMPIPEADYPRCGADWHLIHLSALQGPVGALDEVCAEYRIHGHNGYEPGVDRLDLDHVRDSIAFAAATARSLEALAADLGLEHRRPILSCADLANRLISLRLEPERHPLPRDRRAALFDSFLRATSRRFDVVWPMKALLIAWFAVEALAPRRLARTLAELFLFPSRRSALNRLLGRLRRGGRGSRVEEFVSCGS
jgi:glycosyltransferase involved in cell wall biosynthesis